MNLARARAIVSALPVGDSIKSAQQAARWLVSINDTKGYTFAARYELIDMIDASRHVFTGRTARSHAHGGRQKIPCGAVGYDRSRSRF